MSANLVTQLKTPSGSFPLCGMTQPTPLADDLSFVQVPVKDARHKVRRMARFRLKGEPPSIPVSASYEGWRRSVRESAVCCSSEGTVEERPEELKLLDHFFSDYAPLSRLPVKRPDFYEPFPETPKCPTQGLMWDKVGKPSKNESEASLDVQQNSLLAWSHQIMTNFIGRIPLKHTKKGPQRWKVGEEFLDQLLEIGRKRNNPILMSPSKKEAYKGHVFYEGQMAMVGGKWKFRIPRKAGRSYMDTMAALKGIGATEARKAKSEVMFATEGFPARLVNYGNDLSYDSVIDLNGKEMYKVYYPTNAQQLCVLISMMFTSHYIILSGGNPEWDIEAMPKFNDRLCFDVEALEQKVFTPLKTTAIPGCANLVRKQITGKDIEAAYAKMNLIWVDQDKGIRGHDTYDTFEGYEDFASQWATPLPIELPKGFKNRDEYYKHPNGLGFWLHQAYLLSSICAASSLFGKGRRAAYRPLSDTDVLVNIVDHRASGQQKQGEPFRWALLRKEGGLNSNTYSVVQQVKTSRSMVEGQLDVARNMVFYSMVCNPLSSQFLFAHGVSLTNSNMLKTAAELASNMTDSTAQMDRLHSFKTLIEKKTDEGGPTNLIEAAMLSVLIYAQKKATPCSLFWNKVIPPQVRASLMAYFKACEKSFKHHRLNQLWSREHHLPSDRLHYHMNIDKFIREVFVPKFIEKAVSKAGVIGLSNVSIGDLMTLKKSLGYDAKTLKAHPTICALNIIQCLMEWENNKEQSIATLGDMVPFLVENYPEFTQSSYTFAKVQDISERPIEEVDFFYRMLLTAILLLIKGVALGQTVDLASNPNAKPKAMGDAASFFTKLTSCYLTHADVTAFCASMATDYCSHIATEVVGALFGKDSNICKSLNTLLAQVKLRSRTVSREQVLPAMGIWVCQNSQFADPYKAAHYISNWMKTPNAVVMCGLRFCNLHLAYDHNPFASLTEEEKVKLFKYCTLRQVKGVIQGVKDPWVVDWKYNRNYLELYDLFWGHLDHPYTFMTEELERPISDLRLNEEDKAKVFDSQQIEIFLSTGTGEGQDMYAESLATAVMILYTLSERMGFNIDSIRAMVTSDDIYFVIAKDANPTEGSATANVEANRMLSMFNILISEMGVKISEMKTGVTVKTIDNESFKALIFNSQLWATSLGGVAFGTLLRCLSRSFRELMYTPVGHGKSFSNNLRLLLKFAVDHKFLTEEDILTINRGQFFSTLINNGGLLYYDSIEQSKHIEMAVGCPLIRNESELKQDAFTLLCEHLHKYAFNYVRFNKGTPVFLDSNYRTHLDVEQYVNLAQIAAAQENPSATGIAGMIVAVKQMNKEDSQDLDFSTRAAYHWGLCYANQYTQSDMESKIFSKPLEQLPSPFKQIYTDELVPDSSSPFYYFYYGGVSKSPNRPDEASVLQWMNLSIDQSEEGEALEHGSSRVTGRSLIDMAYELADFSEPDCHCILAKPKDGVRQTLTPCLSVTEVRPEFSLEQYKGADLLARHPYPVITYSPTGVTIVRTHTGKVVLGRDSVAIAAYSFRPKASGYELVSDTLSSQEKLFCSPYFFKYSIDQYPGALDNMLAHRDGFSYSYGLYEGDLLSTSMYSVAQPAQFMSNNISFWNQGSQLGQELLSKVTEKKCDDRTLLLKVYLPRAPMPMMPVQSSRDPKIQAKMQQTVVSFLCLDGVIIEKPVRDMQAFVDNIWNGSSVKPDGHSSTYTLNKVHLSHDEGRTTMMFWLTISTTDGSGKTVIEDHTYTAYKGVVVTPYKHPIGTGGSLPEPKSAGPVITLRRNRVAKASKATASKPKEGIRRPEGCPEFTEPGDLKLESKVVRSMNRVSFVKASANKREKSELREKNPSPKPSPIKLTFGKRRMTIKIVSGQKTHLKQPTKGTDLLKELPLSTGLRSANMALVVKSDEERCEGELPAQLLLPQPPPSCEITVKQCTKVKPSHVGELPQVIPHISDDIVGCLASISIPKQDGDYLIMVSDNETSLKQTSELLRVEDKVEIINNGHTCLLVAMCNLYNYSAKPIFVMSWPNDPALGLIHVHEGFAVPYCSEEDRDCSAICATSLLEWPVNGSGIVKDPKHNHFIALVRKSADLWTRMDINSTVNTSTLIDMLEGETVVPLIAFC